MGSPRGRGFQRNRFVSDYLQLPFNPAPQINLYSRRVVVSAKGQSAAFGEEPFANLARSLIGAFVREVSVEDQQSFQIIFTNGTEIMSAQNTMPVLKRFTLRAATVNGPSSSW